MAIVNENDTVATNEIRFGDNDRLSALVAHLVGADALVLLCDIDGLYDADPRKSNARFISEVAAPNDLDGVVAGGGSRLGTGGMASKLSSALLAADAGVPVLLAAAADAAAALADASVGTVFAPRAERMSARRFWVRYAAECRGALIAGRGAVRAVVKQRRSLLPAGITAVSGRFHGGDVVELRAPDATMVARGVVAYDATELAAMIGPLDLGPACRDAPARRARRRPGRRLATCVLAPAPAARVRVHESHLAMALGWHHDHARGGARGSAPKGVIMGFLQPNLPVVDMDEWSKGTRAERIRPMARHLAEAGFGAPDVVYLAYVLKIGLYVVGGMLFALSTKGIDGFTNVGAWWSEPIVFQKAVLYTMLVEVVGLGCSFGPLSGRYFVPIGSILYWLRPGTIRLPPWPNRVPLTKGTNRTPLDVVLYGALLVLLVLALVSDGSGPIPALDTEIGVLPAWHTVAILAVLGRGRVARQGDLPGRPRRGLRAVGAGVPVHRGRQRSSPRRSCSW